MGFIKDGCAMQELHACREWVERKLMGNAWEMSGGGREGGEYEEGNKLKVVGMVMGMKGRKMKGLS